MSEQQAEYNAVKNDPLADIRESLKHREMIIEYAQKWVDGIGEELTVYLRRIEGDRELEEVCNFIYWNEAEMPKFPNISLKGLIKDIYTGLTGKKFNPAKLLEVSCPACGGQVVAGSVSALKEAETDIENTWKDGKDLTIARLCCHDCYQLALENRHRPSNVLMYPNPFIHDNVSMPYQDFLNTDYWKQVREFIKQRDGGECVLCGSRKNLHTHHKNYHHRGYEFRKDLHTLCGDCHAKFHNRERAL